MQAPSSTKWSRISESTAKKGHVFCKPQMKALRSGANAARQAEKELRKRLRERMKKEKMENRCKKSKKVDGAET